MSKRKSWKQQRNIYKAITRELADAAAQAAPAPAVAPECVARIALPPNNHEKARLRRVAEKDRLREIARAALASEMEPTP